VVRNRPLLIGWSVFVAVAAEGAEFVREGFEANQTFDGTPAGILYEPTADCTCTAGTTTCSAAAGSCASTLRNSASIQAAVAHGGVRAMKGTLVAPGGAGVLISPAAYRSPDWSQKRDLHLRFSFLYEAGYRWSVRNKLVVWRITDAPDLYINCNGVSWPWAETAGAATCDLGVYFGMSPSDSCDAVPPWSAERAVNGGGAFYYLASRTGANRGQQWLVSPGGWYTLEVHVDLVNRRLDLWLQRPTDPAPVKVIDNQTLVGCNGIDGVASEVFDGLEADGYLNSAAGPSGGSYYLDDLVIADSYIGPEGDGGTDGGTRDGGSSDGGPPEDAGRSDAGSTDAGLADAGEPDAGAPDAGEPDAGEPDAGEPDAGAPDAGEPDAGAPDAGALDAGGSPADAGTSPARDGGDDGGTSPDDARSVRGDCGCDAAGWSGALALVSASVLGGRRRRPALRA